ncbi:MAG: hypothetical protein R3C14_32560 [Caldilineaceae bacterium]
MAQQYKLQFLAFVAAALLAIGGLAAQSYSAYASGALPPSGPRTQPIGFDPTQAILLNLGNLPLTKP